MTVRSLLPRDVASAQLAEIRVLSVPSGHVYVQHLANPHRDDGVRRLADPPVGPDLPASQWWPPPALEAAWVDAHAEEFDVFHVHFGFDALSPARLQDLVSTLRRHRKPLVYTVHDLRNPHHRDRALHDAHLDVLIPAAAALITLTPGAADEIRRRWGRRVTVLPHPQVVDEPALSRHRPERAGFVVGLHVKSLRASMDPLPVLDTLARVAQELPNTTVRVDVHTDVVTPDYERFDANVNAFLRAGARAGRFELHVHDCFSDAELWHYLQGLDVSVLPYRFGTHSGWLEACHDLGTTVLAADCGYYSQQRPCLTYSLGEGGLDTVSLDRALRLAYIERPRWRARPEERMRERELLSAAHRDIYESVLAR